jgi:hypothetical protein
MRDARNLSRGREEIELPGNIMEPTKEDTFFVTGLLYREVAEEHALER